MSSFDIRPIEAGDCDLICRLAARHFGSADIVTRGRRRHLPSCPGLIARLSGEVSGFVSWAEDGDGLEMLALVSTAPGRGVGSALLGAAVDGARRAGASRAWLITTNDNTPALRF